MCGYTPLNKCSSALVFSKNLDVVILRALFTLSSVAASRAKGSVEQKIPTSSTSGGSFTGQQSQSGISEGVEYGYWKKNTYAAHSSEIESSRLESHDLQYEDGNLLYLDSYFGGEKFIGEEVLYIDKKPFWSMNYSGRVLDSNFSGDFLKECLLAVESDKPFRGPEIYQDGIFTYHCNAKGLFDWFIGEEEIFFQRTLVDQNPKRQAD
jgi:hypothetical protein